MKYVDVPNVPSGEICVAAVSAKTAAAEALKDAGVAVVEVGDTGTLSGAVASHADLQVLHIGDKRVFISSPCSEGTEELLLALGFAVEHAKKPLADGYPKDCGLNALIIDGRIYCNKKALDPAVADHMLKYGFTIEQVNQGYARCSCAVVAEKAVITADEGIAETVKAHGVDVLKIRPGYIELPGYDTGFIGGCCGLISGDILAFSGELKEHPDYNDIRAFAQNYGVYIERLSKGALTDIGGILPLAEKQRC